MIYLIFFCRKKWWLGTNMVTSYILVHTKLLCKRAFIRDIIPIPWESQMAHQARGKHQMPVWTGLPWQLRCWTSLLLSFTGTAVTFNCSRQVGTAILAMLSEDVLMSTLQSMSTSRGRETGGLKNGSVRFSSTLGDSKMVLLGSAADSGTPDPGTCDYHHAEAFPLWPWEAYKFSSYYVVSHHFTLE